eukprot:6175550-Pleurochrysis_carterae.AAC.4
MGCILNQFRRSVIICCNFAWARVSLHLRCIAVIDFVASLLNLMPQNCSTVGNGHNTRHMTCACCIYSASRSKWRSEWRMPPVSTANAWHGSNNLLRHASHYLSREACLVALNYQSAKTAKK